MMRDPVFMLSLSRAALELGMQGDCGELTKANRKPLGLLSQHTLTTRAMLTLQYAELGG